jgi:ribosomal protein S18 acetylase RimI-like enzyme
MEELNGIPKFEIIKIGLSEIDQLREISIVTFVETFKESNTENNLQQFLNEAYSQDQLKSELEKPNSEFYFAKFGDEIMGYLKINHGEAQKESIGQNTLEVERIYVLKKFHGKKIGQFLLNYALEIAKKKNIDWVWLGVWEHNQRAINFYIKNGFVQFDQHIFTVGDDDQIDILMKLKVDKSKSYFRPI